MRDHLSNPILSNPIVKAALFSGVVATFLALSIPDLRNQNGSPTPLLVVNILWLLSLILSIGSAFSASKVQEWVEALESSKIHQTIGTQTTETHHITETRQIIEIHDQSTGSVQETSPHRPHKALEYWWAFLDYMSALLIVIALEIMRTSLAIAVFSFFAGLVVYVWSIHTVAGHFALAFVCFFIFCHYTVLAAINNRRHMHRSRN